MNPMHLESTSLALRFNPGQFSFNRFDHNASDEAVYDLAQQLNSFQTDDAQVVVTQVFSVW